MLVELRSGETYNGHLVSCDDWMNVYLKEEGDRFWKIPECYIRGSIIKYLRIPDEVIDKVKEDAQLNRNKNRIQHASERSRSVLGNKKMGTASGNKGRVGMNRVNMVR